MGDVAMLVRIEEIELNFCNVCTGNCYLCAKAHGRGNVPMMSAEVFSRVVEQLQDIDFDTIQTSGNGDCFLNPHFMQFLRTLRSEFPDAKMVNYSNFALYTPERTDEVIGERLLDEQFTRIDSMDPDVFTRSAGFNAKTIFRNLTYFIRHNERITLSIGYSSIPQYYRKCRKLLGKLPAHGVFDLDEVEDMPDEYDAITRWCDSLKPFVPIAVTRINQSLWAEREDPRTPLDPDSVCPKYQVGLFDRICWICPNGTISVCGYDDEQSRFIAGNITEEPLAKIWTGTRRQEALQAIATREWKHYPCNPRCCRQYGDRDV
jgi:MoaA/NifB/PqqE/SkfB family radical SAM enzyme